MHAVGVCPNPALDRVVYADTDALDGMVRATGAIESAGGKAVHAAIVAALLGTEATVVSHSAALGAHTSVSYCETNP